MNLKEKLEKIVYKMGSCIAVECITCNKNVDKLLSLFISTIKGLKADYHKSLIDQIKEKMPKKKKELGLRERTDLYNKLGNFMATEKIIRDMEFNKAIDEVNKVLADLSEE